MSLDRERLRAQLERHEGLRLKPYLDTVMKMTIGYGRNLDDVGITQDEAHYLLSGDIDRVIRGLTARYPWFVDLDPVRQAVLVNMGFNLGLGRLSLFLKMLTAVKNKQYGLASDEMIDSAWHTQVGGRAGELAAQMRTGTWNP